MPMYANISERQTGMQVMLEIYFLLETDKYLLVSSAHLVTVSFENKSAKCSSSFFASMTCLYGRGTLLNENESPVFCSPPLNSDKPYSFVLPGLYQIHFTKE